MKSVVQENVLTPIENDVRETVEWAQENPLEAFVFTIGSAAIIVIAYYYPPIIQYAPVR